MHSKVFMSYINWMVKKVQKQKLRSWKDLVVLDEEE